MQQGIFIFWKDELYEETYVGMWNVGLCEMYWKSEIEKCKSYVW